MLRLSFILLAFRLWQLIFPMKQREIRGRYRNDILGFLIEIGSWNFRVEGRFRMVKFLASVFYPECPEWILPNFIELYYAVHGHVTSKDGFILIGFTGVYMPGMHAVLNNPVAGPE